MIDLNQVSLALRNCTPRSLVLLDEFGKGTKSAGSFPNPGAWICSQLMAIGFFLAILFAQMVLVSFAA